jgi:hypothetical protein
MTDRCIARICPASVLGLPECAIVPAGALKHGNAQNCREYAPHITSQNGNTAMICWLIRCGSSVFNNVILRERPRISPLPSRNCILPMNARASRHRGHLTCAASLIFLSLPGLICGILSRK